MALAIILGVAALSYLGAGAALKAQVPMGVKDSAGDAAASPGDPGRMSNGRLSSEPAVCFRAFFARPGPIAPCVHYFISTALRVTA